MTVKSANTEGREEKESLEQGRFSLALCPWCKAPCLPKCQRGSPARLSWLLEAPSNVSPKPVFTFVRARTHTELEETPTGHVLEPFVHLLDDLAAQIPTQAS